MPTSALPLHAALILRPSALRRYSVALAASLAALGFTMALGAQIDREIFFAPFLGAVMIGAWYGGLAPGLVATAVGVAATEFILAPFGLRPPGVVKLMVFAGVAVLISSLTGARRRAEEALRESEERHALAQRVAGIGTWDWELHANRIIWSAETEKIFGVAPGTFPGTYEAFLGCIHPEHRQRVVEAVNRCIEHGDEYELEYPVIRRDGSTRWVAVTGDVVRQAGGRPVRMLGVAQDVTERRTIDNERRQLLGAERAARARAEASERRLLLLGEVSQRLLSTLNYRVTLARVLQTLVPDQADGCIVYLEEAGTVQRVAYRHVDPRKQELLRQLDAHSPLDLAADSPPARAFRTGVAAMAHDDPSSAWRGVAKDPAHLQLLLTLSPTSYMALPLSTRGRVFGVMFLVITESDRKYTDDDLAFAGHLARRAAIAIENARLYGESHQARQEAEAANRSKDEFLATVSHELRTPLNAILGWAVLLRKGRLDQATASRAMESIERNARAQGQLIDDLLDVARITSGTLRVEVRPIELISVIEAALDGVRPSADARGITIDTALDPAAGLVSGDPDRLQQVVWNLLSNAVKFTERGGRVSVRLQRTDADVRIEVADTGEGIPPDLIQEIFDPFRQGDASPSRRHGGIGLGLAIVRHLVELHGGTVVAESPGPGRGATFTVTLPAQEPGVADGAPGVFGSEGRAETRRQLNDVRVLVVDDEAEARLVLKALLESVGAEVETAESVAAALEAFDRTRPDVLLSDVAMPGEDGFRLIDAIRQREALQGGCVPAVAVTAYTRKEDRARLLVAGFQGHVPKPVDPETLLAIIARLVSHPVRSD